MVKVKRRFVPARGFFSRDTSKIRTTSKTARLGSRSGKKVRLSRRLQRKGFVIRDGKVISRQLSMKLDEKKRLDLLLARQLEPELTGKRAKQFKQRKKPKMQRVLVPARKVDRLTRLQRKTEQDIQEQLVRGSPKVFKSVGKSVALGVAEGARDVFKVARGGVRAASKPVKTGKAIKKAASFVVKNPKVVKRVAVAAGKAAPKVVRQTVDSIVKNPAKEMGLLLGTGAALRVGGLGIKTGAKTVKTGAKAVKFVSKDPLLLRAGKKGALKNKAKRRTTKAQFSKISRQLAKDPRVTFDKKGNKAILKIRNKDLKKQFVKERQIIMSDSGKITVREKGLRTDVKALKGQGTPRTRSRIKKGQGTELKIKGTRKEKPKQVPKSKKKVKSLATTTTSVKTQSGNQLLLLSQKTKGKKVRRLIAVTTKKGRKKVLPVSQRPFVKPRKGKVLVAVSETPIAESQVIGTGLKTRGGFRGGGKIARESIAKAKKKRKKQKERTQTNLFNLPSSSINDLRPPVFFQEEFTRGRNPLTKSGKRVIDNFINKNTVRTQTKRLPASGRKIKKKAIIKNISKSRSRIRSKIKPSVRQDLRRKQQISFETKVTQKQIQKLKQSQSFKQLPITEQKQILKTVNKVKNKKISIASAVSSRRVSNRSVNVRNSRKTVSRGGQGQGGKGKTGETGKGGNGSNGGTNNSGRRRPPNKPGKRRPPRGGKRRRPPTKPKTPKVPKRKKPPKPKVKIKPPVAKKKKRAMKRQTTVKSKGFKIGFLKI